MLKVSYKNRIGYYTETQQYGDTICKFRIDICHANCLCAFMYFFKDERGENMVNLHSFADDLKHLNACLKDGLFQGCDNFVFRAKEMNNDLWCMVRLLAENGKKVTIK